jgi:hypothetical protein
VRPQIPAGIIVGDDLQEFEPRVQHAQRAVEIRGRRSPSISVDLLGQRSDWELMIALGLRDRLGGRSQSRLAKVGGSVGSAFAFALARGQLGLRHSPKSSAVPNPIPQVTVSIRLKAGLSEGSLATVHSSDPGSAPLAETWPR